MSIGAWIFLSVVAFVVGPILAAGLIFWLFLRKGGRLIEKVARELDKEK